MRKFNLILALLLCTLLTSSLSVSAQEIKASKVINFHGESENWIGIYTMEVSGEVVAKEGILKYKGRDVDSAGQVTCTFETSTGKLTTISMLAGGDSAYSPYSPIGEKGTISGKGLAGNNNSYSKIEVVKVTVEWNGKAESFSLYKR